MFGPKKTVVLAQQPVPRNPYPSRRFPSLGLGGETKPVLFLVPLTLHESTKFVEKQMSQMQKGGKAFDLITTETKRKRPGEAMVGLGSDVSDAFLHPIKVFLK